MTTRHGLFPETRRARYRRIRRRQELSELSWLTFLRGVEASRTGLAADSLYPVCWRWSCCNLVGCNREILDRASECAFAALAIGVFIPIGSSNLIVRPFI